MINADWEKQPGKVCVYDTGEKEAAYTYSIRASIEEEKARRARQKE